ncbi:von Willebrand factor A domain-related protein [Plasmodium gaboni]|uniref:von Willebrand factor A domain-related protein n=1 Tax=Plasmodium gaboni TaxID=647221 RepID=A0ABY1UM03_9APIC|nr:von Willebrand factor A domain-related protein [Plasmodium gaboni]
MKSLRAIFCLGMISVCMFVGSYGRMNVVSHNSMKKVGEEGNDEKIISCVVEYVIKGDLSIDDGDFCDSNSICSNNPGLCDNGQVVVPGDYCSNYYDITLVVEESSFVQKDYWLKGTIPFLESMVINSNVSKDKAHMSVILFAGKQRVFVPFTDESSQDKNMLLEKINSIDEGIATSSDTLYVNALKYAIENVIFGDGTRKDAPKVAVLFYYGFDYGANKNMIPDVVQSYKEQNVKLIIVGIALGIRDNAYLLADCSIGDENCVNVVFKPWDFVIPAAADVDQKICDKNES